MHRKKVRFSNVVRPSTPRPIMKNAPSMASSDPFPLTNLPFLPPSTGLCSPAPVSETRVGCGQKAPYGSSLSKEDEAEAKRKRLGSRDGTPVNHQRSNSRTYVITYGQHSTTGDRHREESLLDRVTPRRPPRTGDKSWLM